MNFKDEADQQLKKRVWEKEQQALETKRQLESAHKVVSGLKGEHQELQKTNGQLEAQCKGIKRERDNLKRHISAMDEAYKAKNLSYEDIAQMGHLTEQVTKMQSENEVLKRDIAHIRTENSDLSKQVEQWELFIQQETSAWRKRVDKANDRLHRVESQFNRDREHLLRKLHEEVDEIKVEYQREVEDLRREHSEKVSLLESQLLEATSEKAKFQNQMLADAREEAERLEKAIANTSNVQEEMLRTLIGGNDTIQKMLEAELTRRRERIGENSPPQKPQQSKPVVHTF
jgi:chromosome segregation ATPase